VHGPVVDDRVVGHGVAVGLLVVDGVVLDLRHHPLGLHALDVGGADLAGEVRVLAVALEGPAPARVADDVHGRPEVHVDALGLVLGPDDLAIAVRQRGVEGRREIAGGRQLGGVGHSDADRAVLHLQRGDAQPGVAGDVADVGGAGRPVHHGDLLVEGHLPEHLRHLDVDRCVRAHPGARRVRAVLRRGGRRARDGRAEHEHGADR